jgi:hypothetical protein
MHQALKKKKKKKKRPFGPTLLLFIELFFFFSLSFSQIEDMIHDATLVN